MFASYTKVDDVRRFGQSAHLTKCAARLANAHLINVVNVVSRVPVIGI